jgi:Arc/MetJ-type ribon-helix-helix transcriptional regulator
MTVSQARVHMKIEEDFLQEAKQLQKKKRYPNFSEYIRSLIRQDLANEKQPK